MPAQSRGVRVPSRAVFQPRGNRGPRPEPPLTHSLTPLAGVADVCAVWLERVYTQTLRFLSMQQFTLALMYLQDV